MALAFNTAQVWNYLKRYSERSNLLPISSMDNLRTTIKKSPNAYCLALLSLCPDDSVNLLTLSREFGLFKTFLLDATDRGKRVRMRFNVEGMTAGVAV